MTIHGVLGPEKRRLAGWLAPSSLLGLPPPPPPPGAGGVPPALRKVRWGFFYVTRKEDPIHTKKNVYQLETPDGVFPKRMKESSACMTHSDKQTRRTF